MSQFIIFTYAIALLLGFISIGTTGIMTLWTKKKSLYVSLLFYSAYTLDMFAEIIHRYVRTNIPELWEKIFQYWNPVMIITRFFLLFTILIFSHYFIFKGSKKRMVVLYSIFTSACALVSFLESSYGGQTETLEFTTPDYIYFALICFILAYGIVYLMRIKKADLEFPSKLETSFLKKVILFFIISSPLMVNDDFAYIATPFRFAPLLYTIYSILILHYTYKLFLTLDSFNKDSDPTNNSVFQKFSISGREREIVLLVIKGYSNKKISEALFISLSTVKSHIYKIYKKMGVKTRFELMQILNQSKV